MELGCPEVIVENCGDIYVYKDKGIKVAVYAGKSPFSQKIVVNISGANSPMGICTSSGTVGHSLSLGKADAVMVMCKSSLEADAYATALCNKIQGPDDVEKVIQLAEEKPDILGCLIIIDDKLGGWGDFSLEPL